jgi:hypothetical protein
MLYANNEVYGTLIVITSGKLIGSIFVIIVSRSFDAINTYTIILADEIVATYISVTCRIPTND